MSNKIPCGGFKLDNSFLGMNENDELSLTGGGEGKAYQYVVTDGEGGVKWEDRLAYDEVVLRDFVLDTEGVAITGFTMPPVGDTVTVKVNGVESVETVKSGEMNGSAYSYIGSTDMAEFESGTEGWFVYSMTTPDGPYVFGAANPTTTVSLYTVMPHKIADSYLPNDLLRSPYPIQIVNFDKFLFSFGIELIVSGDAGVGTHSFSLSKEKWDEFLNLLDEFAEKNSLCVSLASIVNGVKPNAGRPSFYSTRMDLSTTNIVSFKYYELNVSYNEETETVTAIKSITNKDLT